MHHHHITEAHIKDVCPYCGIALQKEKWNSEWHDEFHYKVNKCSCNREVRIEVAFDGSGHDSWSGLELHIQK